LVDSLTQEAFSEGFRVGKINPPRDPRWEPFVLAHPDGTIYHHPAWLEALGAEYGQTGVHLACEDAAGELQAILPLFYTRGLPLNFGGPYTGRRLSSLPRTPVAGPLSKDRAATTAILGEALALARRDPRIRLEIKASGPELDGMVDGVVTTPWRLSYILELPHESKGPFQVSDGQERAKIRWALNKAAKLGLTVRPAETEADLDGWYRLYLQTMRRSFVPPRPYRFFAALWKGLKPRGMMELLLAEVPEGERGKLVAGSVFFMFGHTVSYSFAGMDRRYGPMRANDAIQWFAINQACKKGFRYFDFGEVPDGHAELAKFKSKWGAQPVRLYRYFAPAPTSGEDALGGAGAHSLIQALWRRLPLNVTAWLGDRVFSYM
jgi:hypothetical protein